MIGVMVGLCALLLLVSASRPGSEEPRLGASLKLSLADTGELEVSPADPLPVLSDDDLRAGQLESGRVEVRNITDVPLDVGFIVPAEELQTGMLAAAQVRVRIFSDGRALADTTVPGLVRGSGSAPIAAGRSKDFEFQAWIGGSDPGLYAGQAVTALVDFELVRLGSGR